MSKLRELIEEKKRINQEIKVMRRRIRKEDGNWFTRLKRSHERKIYQKLHAKYSGDVPADNTQIESFIENSLDRAEAMLDKAIGEQQCSQQG